MSSARPGTSAERADGRRNKQLIVDAALAALVENPNTSMSDIAERAGVTRATVYRHYPDRDELVRAVAAESASTIIPALLEALRPLPWGEAMDLLASQAVQIGAEHREVVLMIAPRLEESARHAVEGEPIQAEIATRRASGELTTALSDEWLALCIRTLCVAAIGRFTDPDLDLEATERQLAVALRNLST